MGNILATSIAGIPEIAAFDEAIANSYDSIELTPILVYLVDTAPAEILPILAEQFDVLGLKGFGIAQTDAERRNVIKKAIELHRYKGTPYAIKEALKTIGYEGAQIEERLNDQIYRDGSFIHDGSRTHGYIHWATFRVILDLGNVQGLTPESYANAVAIINEYKNVRSRLVDLSFSATISEMVPITEELEVEIVEILGVFHNAVYLRDGSQNRTGTAVI